MSVSGLQVRGRASMAWATVEAPTWPPLPTIFWITSRKVSMPVTWPLSMTTSEPRSLSAMKLTASMSACSGWAV